MQHEKHSLIKVEKLLFFRHIWTRTGPHISKGTRNLLLSMLFATVNVRGADGAGFPHAITLQNKNNLCVRPFQAVGVGERGKMRN